MTTRQGRLAESFSALSYAAYRDFSISLLLTSLGAQLIQVAIFWQVYELTGSALLLGLTGLARAGPHIVLSLVGGVAADRLDRVRLVQVGQVLNGIIVFALAGLTLTGGIEVWHLYLITLLNGAFTAVTQPARTAIIPWVIPREKLINAIGLNATIGQTSQIVGPAFGGVAIELLGLGPVYLVNGGLYLLAMLAIMRVRVPNQKAVEDDAWQALLIGLDFVRRNNVIVSLLSLDVAQTLFGSYRALLPILADNLGTGPGGYGALSAAPGIGSLAGSFGIVLLGDMRYKGLYTLFGVLAYSFALVLLAVSPWLWLALIASALLGTMNSVQMIPRNSAILAISPDGLRGRVEAFRSMLAGGAPPLGYMLSGALAAAIGPGLALAGGGVACAMFVAVIGLLRKELRDPELGSLASPTLDEIGTVTETPPSFTIR